MLIGNENSKIDKLKKQAIAKNKLQIIADKRKKKNGNK